MFERFTNQSRRVVVLAQEEARMLNHGYIGCEHLLLGLLHEGQGPAEGERQLRLFLRDTVAGVLNTIEERLTAIERQLGISGPENVRPPS